MDFSVKENKIKNEVNTVQKNDNKSAHKIDSVTGSTVSENKDLDDAAKNLEKISRKKLRKKIFLQKQTKMKIKKL